MAKADAAPQRLTLTIAEAAEMLGIGRDAAYQAAKVGELPTVRFGRRLVVPRLALDRLLSGAGEPAKAAE